MLLVAFLIKGFQVMDVDGGAVGGQSSEAHAFCERFEFHFTPRHGSWLNMAEIEIGLLVRGCLNRRIESAQKMRREVAAYLTQTARRSGPFQNFSERLSVSLV